MRSLPKYLILAFCLLPLFLHAQKEGNNWYFGDSAGITFNTNPPSALHNSAMDQGEAVGSVSDANGNLLFYTDGIHVWSNTQDTMPNGFGLKGHYSSTQLLITKQPGSRERYYIFTTDNAEHVLSNPRGFNYSIVDMGLNGGKGDVDIKNNTLFPVSTEKVISIPHANGSDIWIISHEFGNNKFRSYLLSCNGLDTNHITSSIGISVNQSNPLSSIGQMKVTHDDRIIGAAHYDTNQVELFRFDNITGMLSDPITLKGITNPYGLEFSPNGKKLYIGSATSLPPFHIYQFDISVYDSTVIHGSKDSILASGFSWNTPAAFQLGPDGCIYVSRTSNYLDKISYPDSTCSACNFIHKYLLLSPGKSLFGLPQMPSLRRKTSLTLSGDYNFCPGDTASFYTANDYTADSIEWNFGDPASGLANTSKSDSSFHVYQNVGTYNVTLYSHGGCETDTVNFVVNVTAFLPQVLGADTFICQGDTLLLSATQSGSSFLWPDSSTGTSYEVTLPDTYSVQVTDSNGCIGRDTIVVSLCVGMEGQLVQGGLQVYPNPMGTRTQIKLAPELGSGTLKLIDQQGRILRSWTLERGGIVALHKKDFASGVYFVEWIALPNTSTTLSDRKIYIVRKLLVQ